MKTRLIPALVLLAFLAAPLLAEEKHNTLTEAEKKAGWKLLFDGKTLDGWRCYKKKDTGNWKVQDGCIYLGGPGGGDLMTAEKYGDFEFSIDWKFEQGNNSGIIYRVTEEANGPTYVSGPEMQVMHHKPDAKLGNKSGGSLYDMYAPTQNPFTGVLWTAYKLGCHGKKIEQWVNGVKVVDVEVGSDDWNAKYAASKWKSQKLFASQDTGHIALQDHGAKIFFRNAKIRVIEKDKAAE